MPPSVRRPSSVPATGGLQWYAVHVQSSREEAVKRALERRVQAEGLHEAIDRVIIPVEKISTM